MAVTESARRLCALVRRHTAAAIARRVGASESAVRAWSTGERTPSGAARRALSERYRVPVDGWRVSPPTPGKRRPAAPTPTTMGPVDVPVPAEGTPLVERYRALARQTEAAVARARADENTSARDVASLVQSLNKIYWHIGKLTGEADLTMAMVVRSSAWREFSMRLEQALARHPKAAADVAALFASLDGST
jgi:transcriptional regulator with XRE-family HTH domain